jgi:hypothetical protein
MTVFCFHVGTFRQDSGTLFRVYDSDRRSGALVPPARVALASLVSCRMNVISVLIKRHSTVLEGPNSYQGRPGSRRGLSPRPIPFALIILRSDSASALQVPARLRRRETMVPRMLTENTGCTLP